MGAETIKCLTCQPCIALRVQKVDVGLGNELTQPCIVQETWHVFVGDFLVAIFDRKESITAHSVQTQPRSRRELAKALIRIVILEFDVTRSNHIGALSAFPAWLASWWSMIVSESLSRGRTFRINRRVYLVYKRQSERQVYTQSDTSETCICVRTCPCQRSNLSSLECCGILCRTQSRHPLEWLAQETCRGIYVHVNVHRRSEDHAKGTQVLSLVIKFVGVFTPKFLRQHCHIQRNQHQHVRVTWRW
jgi:hypothetical protein